MLDMNYYKETDCFIKINASCIVEANKTFVTSAASLIHYSYLFPTFLEIIFALLSFT